MLYYIEIFIHKINSMHSKIKGILKAILDIYNKMQGKLRKHHHS